MKGKLYINVPIANENMALESVHISQNGNMTIHDDIQMELTRLSSENLELEAQVESLEKQNKKLKRQLKLYSKKLNHMESKRRSDQEVCMVAKALGVAEGP